MIRRTTNLARLAIRRHAERRPVQRAIQSAVATRRLIRNGVRDAGLRWRSHRSQDRTVPGSVRVCARGNRTHVAMVHVSTTSWDTVERNETLVLEAVDRAAVELSPIGVSHHARCFAVDRSDEMALLGALGTAGSAKEPVCVERCEASPSTNDSFPTSHRVYVPVCSPSGDGVMAEEYAVEIHVRNDGAAPEAVLLADPNPPFPIDVVYTWVDGSDPAWQRRMHRHQPGAAAAADGSGRERFGSSDELRYSMRSIAQHAPWVRNIFLVTDRQVPAWLVDVEQVTVVDHSDIFTDTSVLPVFNSHAIESQLHHIAGLSEHYLYVNDDVFLGALTRWSDFFDPDGTALFSLSTATVPDTPTADSPGVDHSGRNALDLLAESFGPIPPNKVQHIVHGQRRSLAERLESEFADAHTATSASRFRSPADVSFAAFLHHRFGELVGVTRCVEHDYDYIDAGRPDLGAVLDRLTDDPPRMWCFNDSRLPDRRRGRVDAEIHRALERLYPYPAPWEHQAPNAAGSRPPSTRNR